jgi:hypothetical protein
LLRKNLVKEIVQLRCIADFRFILGQKEQRPISQEEAARRWIKERYAESFAIAYNTFGHWDLFVKSEIGTIPSTE